MQNLKTQFLLQLVTLLVILSFPVIAETSGKLQDNIQENNQLTKQEITQKTDQAENNTQKKAEKETIKESSLGTLKNLQRLVHNMQEKMRS